MKIAVIGAGWAGLAAAVEATAGGARVTVFEAGRVAGGRARSIRLDGRTLDNGQHILLGAYRDTLALMRQVGADPERLLDRRPLQLLDDRGFRLALPRLPAPLHLAVGLARAHGVDWREKLNTAAWMFTIQRRRFRLANDCTVAAWLDAAGQTGCLRRQLWEPLCLAALNTPAERASAQLFANVLRDSLGSTRREDTDLLLPRVPLGELLPEPATAWLAEHGAELAFARRIKAITASAVGLRIDDDEFDGAILATAPRHAGQLWPVAALPENHEPIATVYLQFDEKIALPFPLKNLAGKHGQWLVDRGHGLLACVLSGHGSWETLDDLALGQAIGAEIGLGTPRWQRVIREQRATFSARPRLLRPDYRSSHPRLLLAGDHTWADYPATLEGAVRSGRRAARQLLAQAA